MVTDVNTAECFPLLATCETIPCLRCNISENISQLLPLINDFHDPYLKLLFDAQFRNGKICLARAPENLGSNSYFLVISNPMDSF